MHQVFESSPTRELFDFNALMATDSSDDFAALKNYFQGERIKQIPARAQKRRLLARWLAQHFEPGRTYSEKAVNEIIERFHPDFATLRREMIDNGFMRRKEGLYWREMPASPTDP